MQSRLPTKCNKRLGGLVLNIGCHFEPPMFQLPRDASLLKVHITHCVLLLSPSSNLKIV